MMNMFVYKIHRRDEHLLVALCDKELLNRTLNGDTAFEISENFYGSTPCSEKDVPELIKNATMVNAVGNKVVELLVKIGFVEKENVITIEGVQHCQIYFA